MDFPYGGVFGEFLVYYLVGFEYGDIIEQKLGMTESITMSVAFCLDVAMAGQWHVTMSVAFCHDIAAAPFQWHFALA